MFSEEDLHRRLTRCRELLQLSSDEKIASAYREEIVDCESMLDAMRSERNSRSGQSTRSVDRATD